MADEKTPVDTLADALPREMQRVREKVLPIYIAMRGEPGIMVEPAIMMMNAALTEAEQALGQGDVVRMLRAYENLRGFEK